MCKKYRHTFTDREKVTIFITSSSQKHADRLIALVDVYQVIIQFKKNCVLVFVLYVLLPRLIT